jgi:hypothetical protein
MSDEAPKKSERVAVINAVKTYLGFFVLVILIVEIVLGAVALKAQGVNQMIALYGMLFVILVMVAVVSFFAYKKPEALLRTARQQMDNAQPLHDFSNRVSGYWWESITHGSTSISLVEIRLDAATGTVKMKGKGYNKEGGFSSVWESVASCINPGERKVFYYWKGWHTSHPNEAYEGFGEVSFDDANHIERAVGFFSDTNLTDMKTTTRKSIEFRRCPEADIQIMLNGDNSEIAKLINRKLE